MDNKQGSNVVRMAFSEYTPVSASESTDRKGWVKSGVDNLFPQYLAELAQTSTVHGSLCISIGDMIAGKGVTSPNYQTVVDELDLSYLNKGTAHDRKKFGGFYIEVIWSNDPTNPVPARLNHLPYEECRVAIDEKTEIESGIYHSNDWAKASNTKSKKYVPTFIPSFNPAKRNIEKRQVYYKFCYTGSQTYPRPDYWSAVNYIELERQIGIYHVNNIMNGLFPSFIVNFFNGQATDEQKLALIRDWNNKLSGAQNAGKAMFFFNERDVTKPDIQSFPLTDADKQYQFLSEESTKKVMVAHRVVTPLIFGIRDQTGFGSNKDEMAIGLEIFTNQVIEPAQRDLTDAYVDILDRSYPDIELAVIPNTPIQSTQSKEVVDAANASEDVASSALNGAQISSLIDIVIQAVTDAVPITTAKAIVKAGFPMLTAQQVDDIFKDIVPGSVDPTAIVQRAVFSALKLSELDKFIQMGSDTPEGYFILDAFKADENESDIEAHEFTSTGTARPNASSSQDDVIKKAMFITRYRYRGELKPNTREFCRKMLSANKLYRKEDIVSMENKAVNPGWGPEGANTYPIWLYKGGGECHHFWQKEVYMSIEGAGIDVNNPNARQIAVAKAEKLGYKVRNESEVAKLPVDMPFNGFLPTNPRFN